MKKQQTFFNFFSSNALYHKCLHEGHRFKDFEYLNHKLCSIDAKGVTPIPPFEDSKYLIEDLISTLETLET